MTHLFRSAALAACLTATAVPALAQSDGTGGASTQAAPTSPEYQTQAPASAGPCAPGTASSTQGGNLSGKLAQCGGVITPPPAGTVDPGIQAPTPDTGTARVVPPPTGGAVPK